jgi:hypothetical protein
MAVAKAAAQAAEQSEREFQAEINHAVGETEAEIFDEATGAQPLENDGDSSLGAMREGREGEVLDGEGLADEHDAATLHAAETEPDGISEHDDADAQTFEIQDNNHQARDEEADKRRAIEAQNATLRTQLSTLEARFNDLHARLTAQGQSQTGASRPSEPAKPDMFADPEAYEKWLVDRATRDVLTRFQEHQQAEHAQRVDLSLAHAARSERGFEFTAAYQALTALDAHNPDHRAVVHDIYTAPDPARALFDWWEDNGGPQFRERILAQLVPREQRQQGYQQRGGMRQGQRIQPRHEYRAGQSLPSLNGAAGSNAQRVSNPEFLDNTDASVFDFATRR